MSKAIAHCYSTGDILVSRPRIFFFFLAQTKATFRIQAIGCSTSTGLGPDCMLCIMHHQVIVAMTAEIGPLPGPDLGASPPYYRPRSRTQQEIQPPCQALEDSP